MSNYHKPYTPEDSAVVFIDHPAQMTFGVAKADLLSFVRFWPGNSKPIP